MAHDLLWRGGVFLTLFALLAGLEALVPRRPRSLTFRTYVPQPKPGHDAMTVGLQWQDERPARVGWVLGLPFRR